MAEARTSRLMKYGRQAGKISSCLGPPAPFGAECAAFLTSGALRVRLLPPRFARTRGSMRKRNGFQSDVLAAELQHSGLRQLTVAELEGQTALFAG